MSSLLTPANFNKLMNETDKRTEVTVCGYIRQMEAVLELSIVPPLVIHLCIMFYYIQEFFDRAPENLFEISDDKLAIINKSNFDSWSGWDHTIYCHYLIDSMSDLLYKWTFKFTGESNETSYGFGIASSDNCVDIDFCSTMQQYIPNYAIYDCKGSVYKNGAHIKYSELIFNDGDLVKVFLNLKERFFGTQVNDEDMNIEIHDIKEAEDITYKLVLQMAAKGSFTLQDFSIIS